MTRHYGIAYYYQYHNAVVTSTYSSTPHYLKETGVTLAQSVTHTSVPIDMIRVSDNLTMFYIDGPGVFEVFGTRATIREGLSFVKDVTRLNNKAIAVFTQGRLGKRQEEPLQRLVVVACSKERDPVEFRTRRRDSKLAEELTELLSERMPDFRAESLLRT